MFYAIATNLKLPNKDKLVYDILGEFESIKEAYNFLYNNGFKKETSYKYKADRYGNGKYTGVYIWKEEDLDQLIIESLYSGFNYR